MAFLPKTAGASITVFAAFCGLPFALLAADVQPIDQLKAFVQSPPIIEEVQFKITHPPGLPMPPLQDFIARWQPNGLLLLELADNRQTNENECKYAMAYGRSDELYWNFKGRQWKSLTTWEDVGDSFKNQTNGAYSAFRSATDTISKVLNIGVMNLHIGMIEWNGDSFSAQSDLSGAQINGTLEKSPAGYATKMRLQTKRRGELYHAEIDYTYGTNFSLPFFPQRITYYTIKDGQRNLLEELSIHEIKTSKVSLKKELFLPDNSITDFALTRLRQISNSVYADTGKRLEKVPTLLPSQTLPSKRPTWLIAAAITLIAFIAILLRSRRTK